MTMFYDGHKPVWQEHQHYPWNEYKHLDRDKFEELVKSFTEISNQFKFIIEKFIPISALHGENVFTKNKNIPWYNGKTLIEELEDISLSLIHI